MAVAPYGEKLIPFCDSQGLAKVRRLRHVDNHFHSLDWAGVDAWLSVKEAELKDASVSIASKALRNSKWATIIAIIAIVAAIRVEISSLLMWLFS